MRPPKAVERAKVEFSDKIYVVWAIVDENEDPAAVITVYRTRKVEKYWSES
jgi:hypothetical protein